MLHKTKGIVIKTTAFKETSIIVKIFTEKFGVQSYIVNGVRSEKKTGKAALFQPLMILDLVVYKREHKKLERILETKPAVHFHQLHFDLYKSSAAFFIAELLHKSLHEEETNEILFDWMQQQLMLLDEKPSIDASFHLQFMLQLTQHLGFFPQINLLDEAIYFDLINGVMTAEVPPHLHYLQKQDVLLFAEFVQNAKANNRIQRKRLLQILSEYYMLHITGFSTLKSPDVLEEIFN